MKYIIEIFCDNEAFTNQPGTEIARILRELADKCEESGIPVYSTLIDINGNKVGKADIC